MNIIMIYKNKQNFIEKGDKIEGGRELEWTDLICNDIVLKA